MTAEMASGQIARMLQLSIYLSAVTAVTEHHGVYPSEIVLLSAAF